MELIRDMEEKLEAELDEEAKVREKMEQLMDGRLEEVCERIERKIIGA